MEEIVNFITSFSEKPLIVGIQAVQGSGKTTLCKHLQSKIHCKTISLDDFYLPNDELKQLYHESGEELYSVRGNPGTHDVKLLLQTLETWKNMVPIRVPIYDKTCHNGRGDRIGWKTIDPADVLILEGWMLGFKPVIDGTCIDNALKLYTKVYTFLDTFIILKPPRIDIVYEWREEAEETLRKEGFDAMTQRQVKEFVEKYIPTYEKYLMEFYKSTSSCPTLLVQLDERRNMSI